MKIVADLHIHSHFSRATSGNLTFEHLARWAQLKGIHIVGTGDIAHPGWLAEMREKLVPAEAGLFRLRDDLAAAVGRDVPAACHAAVHFILSGEISNIYKRGGQTRKVHNIVFAPSLEVVERLQARLEKIGNIRADGRPILGLDSRDLLEIVLETNPDCHLVPAHIWTPWFSLLGSKSGFDSVEECFADLTPHIFALETGLSSDPPMNWRVSSLDRYTLVSNSDAHSPEKLGREATLFNCALSYAALFSALRRLPPPAPALPEDEELRGSDSCVGTIEFFPEEGKYHLDGHRACGIVWDPPTTLAHRGLCPVCGKEVTIGVMHRVEALADRPAGGRPARPRPFHSLIPLPEVLGEIHGVGDSSKQVQAEYAKLLARLGPELSILHSAPLEEIARAGGERLAEGIGRMRQGEVVSQPGYDGEYGVIRVFAGAARQASGGQIGLFGQEAKKERPKPPGVTAMREQAVRLDLTDAQLSPALPSPDDGPRLPPRESPFLAGLNPEQRAAVFCTDAPLAIIAGPGTGKTRTLTARIAYLILEKRVAPENVLAVTFTNKAAGEMRERLEALLGAETAGRVTIQTFHAFGARLLREHAVRLGLRTEFAILTDEDRGMLLRQAAPELTQGEVDVALAQISEAKAQQFRTEPDAKSPPGRTAAPVLRPASADPAGQLTEASAVPPKDLYRRYEAALRASDAVDFDDLIVLPIRLLEEHADVRVAVQARYRWISVDEYQDVNAAQYHLLRLLAGGGANLCVIGDPDQAIYGFRGADPRYFLRFDQDYPGAIALGLNRNYRSTQVILDAAMQVIAHKAAASSPTGAGAPPLQAVQVVASFADQVRLDVHCAPTDKAEAEYVVHQIEQMVGGTSYFSLDSGRTDGATPIVARSFVDFAILYRLSALSRPLIEAFDRSGIPYQTVGQTPLYAHKAVREVLAHLWLLHTPRSQVHVAQAGGWRAVQRFQAELGQARQAGVAVARLVEQVASQIAAQRRQPYDDADARRLQQLALRAAAYGDRLADFLEATALQSETDAYDPRADRVTLMTLHAAKGLEFPVVFIVGCEEGLLPYVRQGEMPDIEEERRLFYVGLTRGQSKLVLMHARKRVLFGQFMENPASRFVSDIESALKEIRETQYRRPEPRPESGQLSLF